MASEPQTMLTFTEMVAMLEANPDETRRHELIDGMLYVTPSPFNRHGFIVLEVAMLLRTYREGNGGFVVVGGGLYYDEHNYVEPDVLYVRSDHMERVTERYTLDAPDIAVEVSSDSTWRRDLTIKRRLYERTGVGEYWFIDLRNDTMLVHRHHPGYDQPILLTRDDQLTSPLLPGFAAPVAEVIPSFPT
jgi:Uma2 family endonuclease